MLVRTLHHYLAMHLSSLKKTTHSRVAILIAVELLKAILAFLCHIHKVPLILRCTAIGGHLLLLFGMLTTYNTIIIISCVLTENWHMFCFKISRIWCCLFYGSSSRSGQSQISSIISSRKLSKE